MKLKRNNKLILIAIIILATIILPNFAFAKDDGINVVLILKEAIATWYYIIRTISMAIMLVVLIFIGIKMAISTVASDKALYKRMLMDWVAGMVLVFGIHYVMIFILELNETLISVISSTAEAIYEAEPSEYGGIEQKSKTNEDIEVSIFDTVRTRAYDIKLINGTTGMIMYAYLVYYAYKFTFIYFKRYLTVGILTMMAPAVSVSYALNKVISGKTKIFSTWLKEYFFNVILQSIHAIIYVTFVLNALKLSLNSISGMLLAFMLLNFMSKADKIFRKIFAVGGNGSLVDDIADKDVGKELYDSVKSISKAYFGSRVVKTAVKWTGKQAVKPVQKAFGGVMAMRMNSNKKQKEYYKDIDGNTTEFTKEEFEKFENNAKVKDLINRENSIDKKYDDLQKLKDIKEKISRKELLTEVEKKLLMSYKTAEKEEEVEEAIDDLEIDIDREQKELDVALAKFSTSAETLAFSMKKKLQEAFDPRKYTEYDEQKGKYVGVRNKYKARYDDEGNLIRRKKLTLAERLFEEDEIVADSIGKRMKENINAKTVLGMTDDDKKIIGENVKEIKNATVGFFKGFASLPMFIENPVVGASLAISAFGAKSELKAAYNKKNRAKYIIPGVEDAAEFDKGLTVGDVKFVRKEMSKQLNTAKDDYIVESINKKHIKFIKLLAKGAIVATGNIGGVQELRSVQSRKDAPKGSRFTRTGGLGYTEREHVLNQFKKQDELNRQVEVRVLINTAKHTMEEKATEEMQRYMDSLNNKEKLIKETAVASGNAILVNGVLIPVGEDSKTEEETLNQVLNVKSSNVNNRIVIAATAGATIESFVDDLMNTKTKDGSIVGVFNDQEVTINENSTKEDIIKTLDENLDNKIADGNDEKATATVVKIDDKQIIITDAMIEKAIVNAAAKNKQKIGEFTEKSSSFDAIEEELEVAIFKKDEPKTEEASKEIQKAIKTRVEKAKAKLFVTEATTDAYKEIISEKRIKSAKDISIDDVKGRVSEKLEKYVEANPNATMNVVENMNQQKEILTGQNDRKNVLKVTQEALGGKSIEEVATSAVQARHRAVMGINSGKNSSTSAETQAQLKKALEDKHREEMQQLLIAVTQEKNDEKLEQLLESVPQEQRELAYATLEVKYYNEKAKRLKMDNNKPAKRLTFDTSTTESVLEKLNKTRDVSAQNNNESSRVRNEYDNSYQNNNESSRVKDEYDNSYKEQDTRVPSDMGSPANRLYSPEIVTSERKNVKINSKDINSGIDKPLVDLADLIDRIGKNS